MYSFIGRPPDKENDNYLCPRCHNKSLIKTGIRKRYTKQGEIIKQAYGCKSCHLVTTKPIRINDTTIVDN